MILNRIIAPVFIACICIPMVCEASLSITFKEIANDEVEINWTGTGTMSSDPGVLLSFSGLSGDPFGGISGSGAFALDAELALITNDGSSFGFNTYTEITLANSVGDDTLFFSDLSQAADINPGDSYTVLGTALVENLSFSHLTPGTYVASGDGLAFGSTTVTIAAIPEATPMLLGTVACSLLGLTYLGRRSWHKQLSANS